MQLTDDGKLYIHQSDLGTFRMCPEQVRLQATGEYFEADSDSAMIGTLTHKFIEDCLHWRKTSGLWPVESQLVEFVQGVTMTLGEAWPTIWRHPHQIEDITEAQSYLIQACQNWWVNVRPELDNDDPSSWLIEHPFDHKLTTLGDIEVRLRGTIDFVRLEAQNIKDWKTSKAPSGYNQWKLERYDIQSDVYAWGVQKEFGFLPSFTYDHMARGTDKHVPVTVQPTPDTVAMMVQEMESWAHLVLGLGLETPWPKGPADWWCSSRWCSHHARGLCAGAANQIFPEEAHYLTDLIPSTYPDPRQPTTEESP